ETLAFVARRASSGPVALVAAIASSCERHALDGLPEIVLGGLREEHAHALLERLVAGPLAGQVRDRIVAETRGNPNALLEALRGVTPDELAGGFGLPFPPGPARRRAAPLPPRPESLPA